MMRGFNSVTKSDTCPKLLSQKSEGAENLQLVSTKSTLTFPMWVPILLLRSNLKLFVSHGIESQGYWGAL